MVTSLPTEWWLRSRLWLNPFCFAAPSPNHSLYRFHLLALSLLRLCHFCIRLNGASGSAPSLNFREKRGNRATLQRVGQRKRGISKKRENYRQCLAQTRTGKRKCARERRNRDRLPLALSSLPLLSSALTQTFLPNRRTNSELCHS
jgi:hypothetical protein